jgi:hypothetical protein
MLLDTMRERASRPTSSLRRNSTTDMLHASAHSSSVGLFSKGIFGSLYMALGIKGRRCEEIFAADRLSYSRMRDWSSRIFSVRMVSSSFVSRWVVPDLFAVPLPDLDLGLVAAAVAEAVRCVVLCLLVFSFFFLILIRWGLFAERISMGEARTRFFRGFDNGLERSSFISIFGPGVDPDTSLGPVPGPLAFSTALICKWSGGRIPNILRVKRAEDSPLFA